MRIREMQLIYNSLSDTVDNIPQPSKRGTLLNIHSHVYRLRPESVDETNLRATASTTSFFHPLNIESSI